MGNARFVLLGEASHGTHEFYRERAQITKQSMAELVLHLERLGYVERVPDPSDRRAKLVRAVRALVP